MTSAKNDKQSEPKGKVLALGNAAATAASDRQENRRPSRLLVSERVNDFETVAFGI